MAKALTSEEVIKRFQIVHGTKYDYSKVDYIDSSTKVIIICPDHGEFLQEPRKHYGRKQGCPVCSGRGIPMTLDNFISRANSKHSSKYDYSNVTDVGSRKYVEIICPVHGMFSQRCDTHLSSSGCLKCSNNVLTTDMFITEAQAVHGTKFDYSLVYYVTSEVSVTIVCPDHGVFTQTPYQHLHSYGCPKCGTQKATESKHLTTEDFIAKAIDVHGTKYDYSKTTYTSAKEKLTIICPDHGEFSQLASGHLSGYGCKHCVSYGKDISKLKGPCSLYYLKLSSNLYKIGITSQAIDHRYRTKFDREQFEVVFMKLYPTGSEAYAEEQRLLTKHTKHKYLGGKVMNSGNTEIFTKDIFDGDYSLYSQRTLNGN